MSRKAVIGALSLAGLAAAGLAVSGINPLQELQQLAAAHSAARPAKAQAKTMPAPSVTVVRADIADFVETVLVTGTLVAREEILVTPEVEGLRILEVLADEGQTVKAGSVLARIEHETLDAQIAQNAALAARAAAAIAQSRSSILQAEARLKEALASFERAKPLRQSGHLPESTFDQREAAARTAEAQLVAARDGLKVAEAEKVQVDAQRRELDFRRSRTDIKAPADGIVSRRNARIGAVATAAGEAMFRIIADGSFELDAEVTETRIGKLKVGQRARIEVAGVGDVEGEVRLISPEVDKTTRLGRVRVLIGPNAALKLGVFARGTVETAKSRGLALPASAILYSESGAITQAVTGDRIETRRIETGLVAGGLVEVKSGIRAGELIVSRAGSFLRDGDIVRPVTEERRVSEAAR